MELAQLRTSAKQRIHKVSLVERQQFPQLCTFIRCRFAELEHLLDAGKAVCTNKLSVIADERYRE